MSSSVRARRGGFSGCAALLAALLAPAALAQPGASVASYSAPTECPTQQAWLHALRARLPPLLRTHPLIETLAVHISGSSGEGYSGELASSSAATSSSPRKFQGSTMPSAPGLGVAGLLLFQPGLTPGPALGLGGAVRVDGSLPGWQPTLLFGVYSTGTEESRLAVGGRVRFQHWSSHAIACPWRFPNTGPFALRPCLALDAGRSRGDGIDVPGAARRSAPWLSAGAQLRAEVVLWRHL